MEKNIQKGEEEKVKNLDNTENEEQEVKDSESLAQFDSVDEFKNFLNQSKENIIFSQDQIKQKQKVKETNEGLLRGGQLKETNAAIDTDVHEIQDKASALQNGLDKYSEATKILDLIKQKQKVKKTNEGLLRGGQLKEINAAIDTDIADLNQKLEKIVVKKKAEEAEEAETKGTETKSTGVSYEREKSPDEELIEEIQEALKSKDPIKIADITRKIYEMEKGEGANLLDFRNTPEMEKYLEEKLEEFQNKSKKEERAETVGTAVDAEKPKDTKEMTPEEKAKEKEMHDKAMEDKEMLYKTKIDLREDISEEEKTKLKEKVEFVNKEKFEEHKDDFEKLVKLSIEEGKEKDFEKNLENLSNTLGLDKETISNIISNQKNNLVELTCQQSKKKESKWKKIGKVLGKLAIYGGIGVGLTVLTGGIGAGIGLGAARLVETLFKGKKSRKARDAAILESKKTLLEETEEAGMSDAEKKEKDALIGTFYDNIFIELSLAKQNQIDGESKKHTAIGKEINELEEAYDPKNPESKEELKKLYTNRREAHKTQIKKYLEAQGLSGEELDKRVKLSTQLVELEDNQKVMELDFIKRKVGKVSKIFSKLDKILSHPAFFGGAQGAENQTKEKLITAGIFAVAGILARACPIVRNILMAYAGMKLGSAAANLFVSKENKELLKQVSAESINAESNMDDISRAKAQLLDPKFKEANPIEHAKLQEKIFAIDRAKMEKALGSLEGDKDGGYIGETNKKLEETIKKKRTAKGAQKGMKIFLGVAGGVAGWFIGEYLNEQSKIKAEQQAQKEELMETQKELDERVAVAQGEERDNLIAAEELRAKAELAKLQAEAEKLAELNKPVIVEKGDTSWSMAEDYCEKGIDGWEDLGRAQKDYVIDWYKDKMVANPASIGIEGGDASALKIGDSLDVAKIFSDPDEMTRVMGEAKGLSPEAIKNIIANREIIGGVMSQKLETVSGNNLIKAMNIMGGSEQSGAGFVQEFNERATEIVGANITPEQTQIILGNPDVFGKIMDAGSDLHSTDNNTLTESLRLLNDTDAVGKDFVNEIAKMDSPLAEEFSERTKDVLDNIKNKFGDIYHSQMHPDVGLSLVDTDTLSIQTEQALNNSENLIEQGQKIQELIGKSDSAWHKFWGINGKIDRLNGLFESSVEDYKGFIGGYNDLWKEGQSYGKEWFNLTGDKSFLENYFQGDYLKNNKIKIEENIKNLAEIIKGIGKHFAPPPPEAYPGAV